MILEQPKYLSFIKKLSIINWLKNSSKGYKYYYFPFNTKPKMTLPKWTLSLANRIKQQKKNTNFIQQWRKEMQKTTIRKKKQNKTNYHGKSFLYHVFSLFFFFWFLLSSCQTWFGLKNSNIKLLLSTSSTVFLCCFFCVLPFVFPMSVY